jgi:hypothetical protein
MNNERITILLQRPDLPSGKGQPDDEIHIYRDDSKTCRLTHRDGATTSKDSVTMINLPYDDVFVYMKRLFGMLVMDHEPFAFVQFFMPGHPSVLVKTADLQRESLMKSLDFMVYTVLENWKRSSA